MKRITTLTIAGVIAIGAVAFANAGTPPTNNTPVAVPVATHQAASPSPTVQPTTVSAAVTAAKTTPTPTPAPSSAPVAAPAATPTPAPTNDPKCYPRLSIDPYLTNLVSDMQATGYSQAEIDQVIAQTHWVIVWQDGHCHY